MQQMKKQLQSTQFLLYKSENGNIKVDVLVEAEEFNNLRSKISTANFSKIRTNPKVFTEPLNILDKLKN